MPTKNFSFSDNICFISDYICIFVTSKIKTDLKNEEISTSAPCFNHTRIQLLLRMPDGENDFLIIIRFVVAGQIYK